ncbi:succinylglutamate desuccinylase/aspartoacylase family protein [Schleiferia thermophila]|jgi:predicted deacylase|uniref:Succinylglutamate desuccinylase/Aspartoacylase catalytic domain-containing protein n=1 Tax=Schleiferia thermophila TaxID=884107 RepID=A0A369A7U7_9FLAO|nr:succinylglutamate desuccinylase/aspartoacylase family protein [Schleiferia thermophila]KFD39957.1 succinylglutamate desuccinylase [Schleiferia thermophila str. Yellowstone]PMB36676.1 succinylglutamate desuccinylase [Fischerella thermalis CCMEE 5319]RCX05379.1 hypothetical protein DES35_101664 [Schleiferia thermophila]GCD79114.1 succinylglutamate desuccinylase [Schleiferia thermophila]
MEDILIDAQPVSPGVQKRVDIEVARLPSGTVIHMPVFVYRSKNPGPVVMLSGGLHGDEINGVEIIRRVVASKWIQQLLSGTIVALPIINVYGFIHFSREVPDGKDVNRSFPGNPDGSLASIVASIISRKILPLIDYGIDFHTGGASRTNFPQIRYDRRDPVAAELSKAFNAPYTIYSSVIDGSLRSTASQMNKSIIVYEGGESMRFDQFAIEEGLKGIRRVLKHLGMIRVGASSASKSIVCANTTWVRAEASGLFTCLKQSGQEVFAGEVIGYVHNPYNLYNVPVITSVSGHIIGHNNIPLVHRGDALFHIGYT